MLTPKQSKKVSKEIPRKVAKDNFIGTVETKYTDDGSEIILYLLCKPIRTSARIFPIIIPIIARNIPW